MKFLDQAKIYIASGNGGDGCASFRREKYIEFGGDGIYAAWKTQNQEPCFKDNKIGWGDVPIAEKLQKNLMQFTTNQKDESEIKVQVNALKKTLEYFNK